MASGMRQVAELAVPVVLTSATTVVLGVTDTALLGHYGTEALGAAALVMPLWIFCTALVVPFGSATQLLVARWYGAGDTEAIGALLRAGLLSSALIGAAVALVAAAAAPAVVVYTAAAGLDRGEATVMLWILLCGLPFNAVTAHLRGALAGTGDTRAGARNAVEVAVVNLILSAILIFPADLGPVGSALGSTLALAAGTATLIAATRSVAEIRRPLLAPDRKGLRAWRRLAVPDVVFGMVSYGGDAVVAAVVAGAGAVNLAAHRAMGTAISLVWMFVFGIGTAISVLAGQRLGAADPTGYRAVVRAGTVLVLVTSCTMSLCLAAASPLMFGLFSGDPAVTAAARSVAWALPLLAPIMAIGTVYAAELRAAGDTKGVMYASLFSVTAVTLPAVWAFTAVADWGARRRVLGHRGGMGRPYRGHLASAHLPSLFWTHILITRTLTAAKNGRRITLTALLCCEILSATR
ncbi:MATE family efflux transporter [Nocardia mexicana]|nr:MATE family efflux transporter [Nocardia mexicana]